MKLVPKLFQGDAILNLTKKLRSAAKDSKRSPQSVSLSSPTGSGKTVMVTAVMEKILVGDDEGAPIPDATFLWITDLPELNEQTRRKMLSFSTELDEPRLIVIDSAFDQETFRPGSVSFLNIQKLGKDKSLVEHGDDRTFTIWETINNTASARPGRFFVIIDEAHRGMNESTKDRNAATTIIQKFIKGSDEIKPVPLILGISATPERYLKLIQGTNRDSRPVNVPIDEVRISGLLKEVIKLYYPKGDQETDVTMLRAAAQSLKRFASSWAAYCDAQAIPRVHPVLVVQVQDAPGNQISKSDIAQAIQAINEEIGPLPNEAFANAFQGHDKITVGGQDVRYLAPSDIDADPDVQVVFFKTSLNTGWDCPRAEVMMSYRTSHDFTVIAQLVGRMVRTPQARRIDSDEFLNTVPLYLLHYDKSEVGKVVDQLTKPDQDEVPPVKFEDGDESLSLPRAIGTDDYFAALEQLPTYVIPRSRKSSEIKRLMKLGRLLAHDEIVDDAPEKATAVLLKALRSEYERQRKTQRFKTIVEDRGKVEVQAVNWQVGTDVMDDGEIIKLDIAAENVEDLFDAIGRKLGEGLHKAWWKERVKEDSSAKETSKLELFALCTDPTVLKKLEEKAQATVQSWLRTHTSKIKKLPEAQEQEYDEIRRLAAEPELSTLSYPVNIDGKKSDVLWERHLYVDPEGLFPMKFKSSWETKVLTSELQNKQVVAWLRNPDRKKWSLCVPYQSAGEWLPMYPDFLFIRKKNKEYVVDLLDPHLISLADAPAKAAGLATYADKHYKEFDRMQLIIVEDDMIKPLDLRDEKTRNRVKGVTTHEHLKQLFDL